jgi:UDP-2,3-diacylglucosamine pyrophosphatase LpxH
MKYKSIFFSDTHIGSRNCNIEKLLDFLKNNESENIFIVGDFIDGWELKHRWNWNTSYNTLIQKLLRKSRKGTQVYLIIGNHDDFLFHFEGLEFGNIHVRRKVIHFTSNGKKCLVIHGDQFDGIIRYAKWLQKIGSHLYNLIIDVNTFANRILRKFGLAYSFAKTIKQNTKAALNFINKFEECVVSAAQQDNCDIVISGHVHSPSDKQINGVRYINCGSFQEDEYHVVVENENGTIDLIKL